MKKRAPILISCVFGIGCALSTQSIAADIDVTNSKKTAVQKQHRIDSPFAADSFFNSNDDMFKEMEKMQLAMQHLMDEQFAHMKHNLSIHQPPLLGEQLNPVEVLEKDNQLVYKIKIPKGANKKMDVKVENGQLIISANIMQKITRESDGAKSVSYANSSQSQSFQIPKGFDEQSMSTKVVDNTLFVTLTKSA